jgi:hypothetical protein
LQDEVWDKEIQEYAFTFFSRLSNFLCNGLFFKENASDFIRREKENGKTKRKEWEDAYL